MTRLLAATLLLILASTCLALESATTASTSHPTIHAADSQPRPAISADASWARPMVGAIAAMFIAATAIGLIARPATPEILPETHSRDEPPTSTHP